MAMLCNGDYALKSTHENKTVLFVKLTESAQRALNLYLSKTKSFPTVPSIEFNGEKGRIVIPNESRAGDGGFAEFKFDVASNETMEGRQGCFDCVQHVRGTKKMTKVGQLTRRVIIKANEDVYETTRNRMAAIEKEQRKNCTRQLDWNLNMNGKAKGRQGFEKSKWNNLPVNRNRSENDRGVYKSLNRNSSDFSNMVRNKSRPVHNAPPQRPNSNASKARKPLRERVIQMLALKPYRVGELHSLLKEEGTSDCDKNVSLAELIKSVASVSDKAIYSLSQHAWPDVQEDWPCYTDEERARVKKNKLRCSATSPPPPRSSLPPPPQPFANDLQQPSDSDTAGGVAAAAYKRPGYMNGADGLITKKQRISHGAPRPDPAPSPIQQQSVSSSTANTVGGLVNSRNRNATTAAASHIPANDSSNKATTNKDTERKNGVNHLPSKDGGGGGAALSKQMPKYMRDYVTVKDQQQRQQYKADFTKLFREYTKVHELVNEQTNWFQEKGELLKRYPKESNEYKQIEQEICQRYSEMRSEQTYLGAKKRFEYLHDKLNHIKGLINEFDQRNVYRDTKAVVC